MKIDVYHHFPQPGYGPPKTGYDSVIHLLTLLTKEIKRMSAQLDALVAAVDANTTVTGSAIVLLEGLHAKILELLAQEVIDPAAVQQLADNLAADTQALAAAVLANTPTP